MLVVCSASNLFAAYTKFPQHFYIHNADFVHAESLFFSNITTCFSNEIILLACIGSHESGDTISTIYLVSNVVKSVYLNSKTVAMNRQDRSLYKPEKLPIWKKNLYS